MPDPVGQLIFLGFFRSKHGQNPLQLVAILPGFWIRQQDLCHLRQNPIESSIGNEKRRFTNGASQVSQLAQVQNQHSGCCFAVSGCPSQVAQ
ncbi:MAG: hypothetical protein AAFV33_22500, partial [Chloroflexota bacterium]